ncbi:hypothetical protein [Actinocrispum wychmicini]|uniref:Uncharacterized protein n=1 Tax=Actinocrispum wychmicini TaxID=1213861 RepID=A0A4R2J558_9PSEU|nr:hypothetical protein [Actinocrispum wychmicini]TCO52997.1 hypothetical protein EV192_111191 [Actinocrispum wychmicini]
MASRQALDTTILLVGMSSGVFAGFAPSWFTVASPFFHEQGAREGNIRRIRWAEVAGSAITVAMGWALAHEERSAKPLIASVLISVTFVMGYEYMIRHPSTDDSAAI